MRIAVGLSGGVDSSTAAALLKDQGHEVFGVTMAHAQGLPVQDSGVSACFGGNEQEDIQEAQEAADHIGIPLYVIDLSKEYQDIVLSYFRTEYLAGRTPNPCVLCNQKIKFQLLLDRCAEHISFDAFATGHYARIHWDETFQRFVLLRGKDRSKDQSYFLSRLKQHQLKHIVFPLGEYAKEEVRSLARSFGLPSSEKTESQDFYSGDYRDLFDSPPEPGNIIDREGNILGTHEGIVSYTIGQRRGLGISSPYPLYVISINGENNTVTVGPKEALLKQSLTAEDMNWFYNPETLEFPLQVTAKIRHGQKEYQASLFPHDKHNGIYRVSFASPLQAVTPGQAVVCYQGERVIASGFIQGAWDET